MVMTYTAILLVIIGATYVVCWAVLTAYDLIGNR